MSRPTEGLSDDEKRDVREVIARSIPDQGPVTHEERQVAVRIMRALSRAGYWFHRTRLD